MASKYAIMMVNFPFNTCAANASCALVSGSGKMSGGSGMVTC